MIIGNIETLSITYSMPRGGAQFPKAYEIVEWIWTYWYNKIENMKATKVLAKVSSQLKKIFGINTTIRDIINGHRTTNIGRFLIKISVIV